MTKHFPLVLLILVSVGSLRTAYPCTMFTKTKGGHTLVGNGEDFFEADTHAFFIPASRGKYGRVYFGWANVWPQGGMNDQGLVFDIMAVKKEFKKPPEGRRRCAGVLGLIKKIMEECATVEQALAIMNQYVNQQAAGGNLMFADARGDSAIIEGYVIHRRRGPFQVCTNFRLSRVKGTEYPCRRYRTALARLLHCPVTVEAFRNILHAVHEPASQQRGTLYSNIYDVDNKLIYLYLFHDFENVYVIDVEKELAKGQRVVSLEQFFPDNIREADFRRRYEARKRKAFQRAVQELGVRPRALVGAGLERGLALHLPLDVNANDIGPNELDGKMADVSPTADRHGRKGGATAFDGEGGIDVPNHRDLHLSSGDFTISLWLKLARINEEYWTVLEKVGRGALDYWLMAANGNLEFRVKGRRALLLGVDALAPERWYHVVIRQDVSSFRLALFLNGEKQYASIIQTVPCKNNENLHIGFSGVLKESAFHGALDDLRIFRRALTDDEIKGLFESNS